MNLKYKIIVLVALGIILNTFDSKAQKTVALNHNGSSKFYSRIDSAIINAQHGDTIYIAGGNYNVSNLLINKKLSIFGAGINPDTANVTKQTYLNGSVTLLDGCDSSFIEGIYISGDLIFGNNASNQAIDNITISRCYMTNTTLGYNNTSTANNILYKECIINGSINGQNAQNILFSNNIIVNLISTFSRNVSFNNNIFLKNTDGYNPLLNDVNEAVFSNNIFLSAGGNVLNGNYAGSSSSEFYNNIFCFNYSFPYNSNTGNLNLVGISQATIFENQTGYAFSFSHNYHLKVTCVGINAGTDGTDIGIYGGAYPFKDGNNPKNPHIKSKAISSKTNNNGKIGVNIQVNAQDN